MPGTFALTFDDGPDDRFTPQVLDILASRGATATFFMVGHNAQRYPELVRRVVEEGHGLGSHTWSHPELAELSWPRQLRDCRRGRGAVERIAKTRVRAYRPPKGHWDARGALVAKTLGLEPWLWTLDPADWRADATTDGILRDLRPLGSGDVVLLHDGIQSPEGPGALDRSPTVEALGPLLDLASDRGLRPVGLDAR
jgi:peptidoglycan/xylan/chitin deacetylase (PgdA/CDA1 family)